LQAGGHRFDPGTLHRRKPRKRGFSRSLGDRGGDERSPDVVACGGSDSDRLEPHTQTPRRRHERPPAGLAGGRSANHHEQTDSERRGERKVSRFARAARHARPGESVIGSSLCLRRATESRPQRSVRGVSRLCRRDARGGVRVPASLRRRRSAGGRRTLRPLRSA
jgi:hypothetical protein